MEDPSYHIDQQLKQYKKAITEAYKQFHLDDDARIAAAHAVINSAIADYRGAVSTQEQENQRMLICGMLSIAAACHLISFDEIAKYKQDAEIYKIEVPFKMVL